MGAAPDCCMYCLQELNETKVKLERARSDAEEFQRRFLQVRALGQGQNAWQRRVPLQ
jgi:hypothetical protein